MAHCPPSRSLQPLPMPHCGVTATEQAVGRPGCHSQGPVSSQVIIVIYLSAVGALLLYMAFLMLVDPLIRKPDAYTEQLHSEEENEVRDAAGSARPVPHALGGRGPPLPRAPRPPLLLSVPHVAQTPAFPPQGLPRAPPG